MFPAVKLSWIVWIGLLSAITAGLYSYYTNPIGDYWYTPPDWCEPRSHSFSDIYQLILAAAMGLVILRILFFSLLCGLSRSLTRCTYRPDENVKEQLISSIKSSVLGIAILLLAMFATPIFEHFLPLKPDPKCIGAHRSLETPAPRQ